MERVIPVVAAVIFDGEKFLITQRPKGVHNELKWEFPGGKIEFGENPEESLKREIMEELGIEVEIKDLIGITSQTYDDKHIILIVYLCYPKEKDIKKIEINDFAWVTVEEARKFDLAEGDKKILTLVESYLKSRKF